MCAHCSAFLLLTGSRQSRPRWLQVPCEALIRVRTVATGSDQNLCPFDCSDHGSCPGLRASSEVEEDATTATQAQPTWSSIDDAVRCTCAEEGEEQSQYTGRFCEATLSGVNPRNRIQLDPGEWQAHQFDVKENSAALSIELTVLSLPSTSCRLLGCYTCSEPSSAV